MDSRHGTYLHEDVLIYIEQANAARLAGNEGNARVCARRAASLIIAEYLNRQGMQIPSSSAHDRLRYLSTLPGLSPAVYETTKHLLMRVDESFSLPDHDVLIYIDLIEEVQRLSQERLTQ